MYGHTLEPVVYTQGMSISGRLRLSRLDPTYEDPVPGIVRLVEPYVSGEVRMFDVSPATSALAGLIWGMQLFEVTRDRRYADMVLSVAERYRTGVAGGAPPPSDPDYRTEDMFMNGAMLGRAFRLSGERRYLDLLTRFLLSARTPHDAGGAVRRALRAGGHGHVGPPTSTRASARWRASFPACATWVPC